MSHYFFKKRNLCRGGSRETTAGGGAGSQVTEFTTGPSWSPGIIGMHHHTQFIWSWGSNLGFVGPNQALFLPSHTPSLASYVSRTVPIGACVRPQASAPVLSWPICPPQMLPLLSFANSSGKCFVASACAFMNAKRGLVWKEGGGREVGPLCNALHHEGYIFTLLVLCRPHVNSCGTSIKEARLAAEGRTASGCQGWPCFHPRLDS